MVGVLGGGQLGAMFAQAARRLGYRVAVWDPDPDAPAHRAADHSVAASFSDPSARDAFSRAVQAVTFEWENVPADLCDWLEQRHPVRPGSEVLRIIQDRIVQKQFLQSRGLPVPSFAAVTAPDALAEAAERLGLPALCKTATAGYDGKGQWMIRRAADAGPVIEALRGGTRPGMRWILETFVEFDRELSVLIVRSDAGDCRTYPVVENRHDQGILRVTLAPASVPVSVAQQAADLAVSAVAALDGVGVFCVELFQRRDGALLINEIAPRPHNSGHYTLDACSCSQFEQQVRVLCGLPLGEVRMLSPAAMVNLIGEEARGATADVGSSVLFIPGAVLHLYGKRVVRAGRKMGHVTFLAERGDIAAERAAEFIKRLSSES
ncbi:N5-carboxyaminoimidazole ribonucleotide synthase [Nitrospira moscoviensis]|uniref:N5-carboxyaminoimidazole ribonucleotide synthase n=2 Tax=Nitrospira moscoviensis TaxID=42253 RepID=A0A0K2GJ53_NITMO|nr:N5-carboxyaminoimidazole ribonucleotide synthase [Nitrospira moscoviensis]